jgi:hypothetical protein
MHPIYSIKKSSNRNHPIPLLTPFFKNKGAVDVFHLYFPNIEIVCPDFRAVTILSLALRRINDAEVRVMIRARDTVRESPNSIKLLS